MLAASMLVAASLTYVLQCMTLRRLLTDLVPVVNARLLTDIVPVVNALTDTDIVPVINALTEIVPVVNAFSLASM